MPDEQVATSATPNVLEQFAREIVDAIAANETLRGFDPISIMTVIITIFQTLVQQCPKPASAIAEDVRHPSLMQRVALRKKAHEMADSTNTARSIYNQMMIKSSQLTKANAESLVTQALSDSNLLV